MKYCINCGKELSDKAKFCAHCGERQSLPETPDPIAQTKPKKPEHSKAQLKGGSASFPAVNLNMLDPGTDFNGYHIIRVMNKDEEGIKYIASKDERQYVLKLFFHSRLTNLDKLFGLQMRLSRLNLLDDEHIARVEEVNQTSEPAYMAARFVDGISLDRLKKQHPEQVTEVLVRDVAVQLMQTAISIRQQGLTITKLNLSGLMIDKAGKLVILSSGITYEDNDEREDIFVIGVILTQLLCRHTLYASIYSADRLSEVKFSYLQGVSVSFNKILAECLHRNIMQRYAKMEQLLENLQKLPPVDQDEIWNSPSKPYLAPEDRLKNDPKPKFGIEWGFIALVAAVLIIVGLFLFTNLFSILFRGSDKPFKFSGFLPAADSLRTEAPQPNDRGSLPVSPSQTEYGALKSSTNTGAEPGSSRGRYTPLPATSSAQATAVKANPVRAPMPANMVRIDAGSFGFGRLKENLNHNVSQNGFYISRYELTQGDWNRYMTPSAVSREGSELPVDNVSWMNVIIYCNGRSKAEALEPAYIIDYSGNTPKVSCNFSANGWRLPTEAEWEMAAKAGALFEYSGSDNPDDVAWYRDNSAARIRAGGGKKANGNGLYDMTGNVAEWCWDWYDANYTRTIQKFINPTGPETGTQRVVRGGSVMNGEGRNLNILYREKGNPNRGVQYVGFRLVRTK